MVQELHVGFGLSRPAATVVTRVRKRSMQMAIVKRLGRIIVTCFNFDRSSFLCVVLLEVDRDAVS